MNGVIGAACFVCEAETCAPRRTDGRGDILLAGDDILENISFSFIMLW